MGRPAETRTCLGLSPSLCPPNPIRNQGWRPVVIQRPHPTFDRPIHPRLRTLQHPAAVEVNASVALPQRQANSFPTEIHEPQTPTRPVEAPSSPVTPDMQRTGGVTSPATPRTILSLVASTPQVSPAPVRAPLYHGP